MKMPIPDDWDGFSVCDYAVRWPDSNIWRIILRGLLTNPALADFWDPNTGDVAQVLEDFEPIVNYVLNSLECGDMNIPIGSGMEFFGSVLPDKFLWQDGSKVTVEAIPSCMPSSETPTRVVHLFLGKNFICLAVKGGLLWAWIQVRRNLIFLAKPGVKKRTRSRLMKCQSTHTFSNGW